MPFEPGRKKTGGRKPGSKNKNYLDPNFWCRELYDLIKGFEPKDRADTVKWLISMIFTKINAIPGIPGDSVENAQRAMDMLKNIEPKVEKKEESVS